MTAAELTTRHLAACLGQLDPVEKWHAMRRGLNAPGGGQSGFMILLGVLCLAGAAILAAGVYRWLTRSRHARGFQTHAHRTGLTEEEKKVLRTVARFAELRRADAVFTLADAFDRGTARLLASDRLTDMPAQWRGDVAAMLERLREKLGFADAPGRNKPTAIAAGRIPDGETLSVHRRGAGDYFDAQVTESTDTGLQVRPDTPLRCEPGERWQVRYSDAELLWEFDALVVRQSGELVALKLAGAARPINRRRFGRVPADRAALLAPFPFSADAADAASLDFQAARLVEMAGPGFRVESPVRVEVGGKILLGVKVEPDRILQSLAIVRRVSTTPDGRIILAGEMVGLSTAEVADLVRGTNLAAADHRTAHAAGQAAAEEGPARQGRPAPAGVGA